MAPFYDLVSTILWPELSTGLAMNIGNGKNVNDVNPAHFRRMAEEASLGWPMVRERIETLSLKAIETLEEGSAALTSPDAGITARLSELVIQRCRKMRQLSCRD
jgi:serine/threonine-protein kinase HipA